MAGIIYVGCTPVTRHLVQTHLQTFTNRIPLLGIVNLDRTRASTKANYDSMFDLHLMHEIPIHYCRNVNDDATMKFISRDKPTLIIQSGWSQKFRQPLLELPEYGCVGQHPSPIPKGRGAACVNWAILHGEQDWGDTFFRMVDAYDAGPVYAQKHFRIEPWDTCNSVYDKVASTASEMLSENLLSWYAGQFQEIPIDESHASNYPRRTPADGKIDFSWDATKLQRTIQALTHPFPGAFFMHAGKKVIVWDAEISSRVSSTVAGRFLGAGDGCRLDVAVGSGQIWRLRTVQVEGQPQMTGAEFFRRYGRNHSVDSMGESRRVA
jgi:methionyl-tRNA formyltransferase